MTKVEFFNAPVNGTATLAKSVAYTYDDSSNRINKTLTVPGQTAVAENYVYDGDQLVAVMNATGAIQHEYFDGSALDQVFADQTTLSGVLWPLEVRTGAARDVISTAGVVLDHRKIDSFGKITSQTNASVDYDQFFSGLSYDADSQLYYARARWYDPVGGKFIGEDPLRFGAGDTNLSRYSANDPVNRVDRNGMLFGSLGSFFSDVGQKIGDTLHDAGTFVEKQWDNGNIQKSLLVAGTLATAGMLGFGLAAGTNCRPTASPVYGRFTPTAHARSSNPAISRRRSTPPPRSATTPCNAARAAAASAPIHSPMARPSNGCAGSRRGSAAAICRSATHSRHGNSRTARQRPGRH